MKLTRHVVWILLLLLCAASPLIAQEEEGKLDEFEKELQDTTDIDHGKKHCKHEDKDDSDNLLKDLTWEVFRFIFLYCRNERMVFYDGLTPGYNDYPYCPAEIENHWYARMREDGYTGKRVHRSGLFCNTYRGFAGKSWHLTGMSSYFRHSSDLHGYQFSVRGSLISYFDLSMQFTELSEETGSGIDRLSLRNYFLEYNRFRFSEFVFRWGVGLKTVAGDDSYTGVSTSFSFEVYPGRPVSIYYHYSGASVGSAYVSEHQFRLNYHHERFSGHLGYQNFKADKTGIPGVLIGVAVHF